MIFSNILFVTFVFPLASGCPSEENGFLIPSSEQKLLNSWLSPLSEMIVLGMPNLQIMFFHTKFQILALVIVDKASASTYLVK